MYLECIIQFYYDYDTMIITSSCKYNRWHNVTVKLYLKLNYTTLSPIWVAPWWIYFITYGHIQNTRPRNVVSGHRPGWSSTNPSFPYNSNIKQSLELTGTYTPKEPITE